MHTLHQDRGSLARPTRIGDTLTIEGHVARVHAPGDGLDYGDHHEYRRVDEVRRIVAQLAGLPVTLGHPVGLVKVGTPARIVGKVDRAWLDGEHAAARMIITDRDAVAAIESGTRELSLGYGCEVDAAGYQRSIELDHLAIVEAARCGATCSLRVDTQTALTATGVTMYEELIKLARAMNVRTDGLSRCDAALAVLRATGTNVDGPCSDDNAAPIASRSDDYVIARAYYQSQGARRTDEQRRDFATAPIATSTTRTDCGCSSNPAPAWLDEPGSDLESDARSRMTRRGRLAYAQGTEHADEVEAIERIRERAKPIARPVVNARSPVSDEVQARARMNADSRNAHRTPVDIDDEGN